MVSCADQNESSCLGIDQHHQEGDKGLCRGGFNQRLIDDVGNLLGRLNVANQSAARA